MSVTAEEPSRPAPRRGVRGCGTRQLRAYPDTGPRTVYLAITVLATITLYYELYVSASVSTLLLTDLHMSFTFYVVTLAFGNLIGAFGSLLAGITDRLGRANLVVGGLLVTGCSWPSSPRRDQQVVLRHRVLRRRAGRGHLPGRHPGADP